MLVTRIRQPLGQAPSARRVSRVASRLPGTTRLRFALHGGQRLYSSPDDLFLYDRGYPVFWLFAFHAQEQRHYCARVRHDFHSEVKAFVADGAKERIVVLTPNTASARQCRALAVLGVKTTMRSLAPSATKALTSEWKSCRTRAQ